MAEPPFFKSANCSGSTCSKRLITALPADWMSGLFSVSRDCANVVPVLRVVPVNHKPSISLREARCAAILAKLGFSFKPGEGAFVTG